jgi:hypothetical protein
LFSAAFFLFFFLLSIDIVGEGKISVNKRNKHLEKIISSTGKVTQKIDFGCLTKIDRHYLSSDCGKKYLTNEKMLLILDHACMQETKSVRAREVVLHFFALKVWTRLAEQVQYVQPDVFGSPFFLVSTALHRFHARVPLLPNVPVAARFALLYHPSFGLLLKEVFE